MASVSQYYSLEKERNYLTFIPSNQHRHEMGSPRLSPISTSNNKEDKPHTRKRVIGSSLKNLIENKTNSRSKRPKLVNVMDVSENEDKNGDKVESGVDQNGGRKGKRAKGKGKEDDDSDVEEFTKPIGEPIRISSKGIG